MTTVYFVRHGTTASNAGGRFQGSSDIPLGDMGLRQADALGERFRDVPLDAVYCSPLKRARQTADGVCKYKDFSPIIENDLREIDGGALEGHTNEENTQKYPDVMYALRNDPARFDAPEGEKALDVWKRVKGAIEKIVVENPDRTIAIVSHGFALMTYFGTLEHEPEHMETKMSFNASVTTITYENPDEPTMVHFNNTDHLPDDMQFISKFWKGKMKQS